MSTQRTLLTIGSGPGIGSSVATVFGSSGFDHIILVSRELSRLQNDKQQILSTIKGPSPKFDIVTADIADQASLKQALQKIEDLGGHIECIHFNAARVAPSAFFDFTVAELEQDFKVRQFPLLEV
jgi:NAD(P)-dependent dehydrogenase (short-subunit alcohol dehydrogenase family)